MKYVISLLIAITLSACGKNKSMDPLDCGCNPSANVMQIKTPTGVELVNVDDVIAVKVTIAAVPGVPGSTDTTKSFDGNFAKQVAIQFGLGFPQLAGAPAGVVTGEAMIVFNAQGSVQQHMVNIINNKVVEDSQYPDVTYDPETAFDANWLASQPN